MAYFVTARKGPGKVAWLAGPYITHGAALRAVPACTRAARQHSPYEMFDAGFGTARVKTRQMVERIGLGRLNDAVGYEPDALP